MVAHLANGQERVCEFLENVGRCCAGWQVFIVELTGVRGLDGAAVGQ
jgi:hypothetical protein